MKIFKFLFSGAFMGFLMVVFAISIGYATFIENDYDATTARLIIYNASWFELLLVLMVINFLGMIYTKRLYRKSKLNILMIHLSLVIIILGAGITRYFGFEGVMHIRTGQSGNTLLTTDTYVNISLPASPDQQLVQQKVLLSHYKGNLFQQEVSLNDKTFDITLKKYFPAAQKRLIPDADGEPFIHIIVGASDGRHDVFLKEGQIENLHGFKVGFGVDDSFEGMRILRRNDSLFMSSPLIMSKDEQTGTATIERGVLKPINIMELQTYNKMQFVVKEFSTHATITYDPVPAGQGHSSEVVLFTINDQKVFVEPGVLKSIELGEVPMEIYVGQQEVTLPFSLKLNAFKMERYPGSNSPSSFASEITLIDEENNLNMPYRIFMNNILEYQGYRFYQSSYDQDERGTVLSVNHDYWGTRVTYLGYFLLFASMILSFFMKNNRFRNTLELFKQTHEKRQNMALPLLILLFALPMSGLRSQPVNEQHANSFGELIVQSQEGRMMPINTLATQLMIKVHKKATFQEVKAEQVLLSILIAPEQWMTKPFVRVNHEEVQKLLGASGHYASYADFFNDHGQFKLSKEVKMAYNKKPALRNMFDKELIKVSERINIYHNLLTGNMLNILPLPNDPKHTWTTPVVFEEVAVEQSSIDGMLFERYVSSLRSAVTTNDYSAADADLAAISEYQRKVGAEIVPSASKVQLEIIYNRANIFKRLFMVYLAIGVVMVALFFIQTLKPEFRFKKVSRYAFLALIVAFGLHTFGLILRWYISGHAPWSNGYESMIYIAWATVLAGFLFMKKAPITMGLTATLAGITLLTAHMSWMDPEITNLVPVLKSYWLTIHVAAITASYGFLGLAAIMGFFNLTLMPFRNQENQERLNLMLKELTLIIELSLMSGLTLLIIGNFLGAIWANESWGRYWGWDPKETWTLVTIMFYSFILHLNLIPGLKGLFLTNFLSLIGFSTVLMTYFGVNFYLSGLHSYAGGDPVPVPVFVYYTLLIIAIVSTLAAYNSRTLKADTQATVLENS